MGSKKRYYKVSIILLLIMIFSLLVGCDKSSTGSDDDGVNLQRSIEWPSLADSPWPMYKHDPQLTGRSDYPGPQTGEVIWSISIPKLYSKKGFTSFAIGPDSTIYFGSSYEIVDGGTQSWYLYAIDPSGNIKWKYRDENAFAYLMTGPLITSGGKIIFGAPTKDVPGRIYALDNSGSLCWSYTTSGRVYIAGINIDKEGNLYFSDDNGSIYSLDRDGNLRWKITSNDSLCASDLTAIPISPDGENIYVANVSQRGSTLYAISTDGNIEWSYDCGDSTAWIYPSIILDCEGNIYFTLYNSAPDTLIVGLYSLKSDGTLRWKVSGKINSCSEPTIDWEGNIYVVYKTGSIYSFKNNGEIRFILNLDNYITAPLTCDKNNNLLAISDMLYILSPDGNILNRIDLPCETFVDPAMDSQGNIYLGVPCQVNSTINKIK